VFCFLYLHFNWLFCSWNQQRVLKKKPFWKYESWFPSEVSKLSSVQIELNLSLKYWHIEAKVGFWICYCPKNWSKYHLDTIQTMFSEKNSHLGTIMVKIFFVHVWKCIISGVFHRSEFSHLRGKSTLIFSKWLFFQNSLVISTATWWVKMQARK
jgi:hypothetical protein